MIVFPMAGLSRRFRDAGYERPKYMLEAHGCSLFRHAVESFCGLFADESLLFIARDEAGTVDFITRECAAMGVVSFQVVVLEAPTRGQAETVRLGVERAAVPAATPLLIFNIDTFRPGYSWPQTIDSRAVDGYLEVFVGSGSQWSFVRPSRNNDCRVAETAEKRPISDLCCTGLYWFSRCDSFIRAYDAQIKAGEETLHAGELYVAPLYNFLIAEGADIRFNIIDREAVIFCGVPAEYDAFCARSSTPQKSKSLLSRECGCLPEER